MTNTMTKSLLLSGILCGLLGTANMTFGMYQGESSSEDDCSSISTSKIILYKQCKENPTNLQRLGAVQPSKIDPDLSTIKRQKEGLLIPQYNTIHNLIVIPVKNLLKLDQKSIARIEKIQQGGYFDIVVEDDGYLKCMLENPFSQLTQQEKLTLQEKLGTHQPTSTNKADSSSILNNLNSDEYQQNIDQINIFAEYLKPDPFSWCTCTVTDLGNNLYELTYASEDKLLPVIAEKKILSTGNSNLERYENIDTTSINGMDFFVQYDTQPNQIYLITSEGKLVPTKIYFPNSCIYRPTQGIRQYKINPQAEKIIMTVVTNENKISFEQPHDRATNNAALPNSIVLSETQLKKISELKKNGHKIYTIDKENKQYQLYTIDKENKQYQLHDKSQFTKKSASMYHWIGGGVSIVALIGIIYLYCPSFFKNLLSNHSAA